MIKSVKIYLTFIFTISLLLLLYSYFISLLDVFSPDKIYLTISLIALIVFVNQNPTEDADTKTRFMVFIPILLPVIIFLPVGYVCIFAIISYIIIYFNQKSSVVKKLFNIATTVISAVLSALFYDFFVDFTKNGINIEALYVMVLFITSLCYILTKNLLVYCVIALERGQWSKSSIMPLLIVSKSTMANIFLGIINVYVYYYSGIIGLIISTFVLFAAKPLLYHYISENNDLTSHTKLILTLLKHKDPNTYHHSNRVTHWTMMIAQKLNMSQTEVSQLSQAASWHDIGKIEIDTELLNREGRLSDEEFADIKRHPELGYQMVKDLTFFKKFLGVIRHHHERMDGKGYPLGLKGENIPFHARIVCVADSFDAMTMDRPYRCGMSMAEAVEELIRCSGTQFDPNVVKIFVESLKDEYGENYERWNKNSFETA
jgi:putative nucleotidyltransferase with HDIG domain